MADERDPATEDRQGGEATQRMPADEPTSTFDPFADDDHDADVEVTRAMSADAEVTRAMPADVEVTRAMPADVEVTRAMSAGAEATQKMTPNVDATRTMPVGAEATQKMTPDVWAARASVPVRDFEPMPGPESARWREETGGQDLDRPWLRPVLIALVVLILLAMLGTGLWLIYNRSGVRSAPAPGISATASAIPTPTETLTATDTPTASITTAAQVAVPNVVGQSEAAASQQLTAKGLAFTVSRRATNGVNPGTVLATEPGAGAMVARGTQVTLVVAAAPAPAPTRTAAPTQTAVPSKEPPASPSASR